MNNPCWLYLLHVGGARGAVEQALRHLAVVIASLLQELHLK